MLNNLKTDNDKLKIFMEHVSEQFLTVAHNSGIIDSENLTVAKKSLSDFIYYVDFTENRNNVRAIVVPHGNKIEINKKYEKIVDFVDSFDDGLLDDLKQTIFHEYIHVLQINNKKQTIGWRSKSGNGNVMNEIAAGIAEEMLWKSYLQNIKRASDVHYVLQRVVDSSTGRVFHVEKTIENMEEYKKNGTSISSYYREISIGLELCKSLGIKPLELIKGSMIFGEKIRKSIIRQYEGLSNKNFDKLLYSIDDILVFNRESHEYQKINAGKIEETYSEIFSDLSVVLRRRVRNGLKSENKQESKIFNIEQHRNSHLFNETSPNVKIKNTILSEQDKSFGQ